MNNDPSHHMEHENAIIGKITTATPEQWAGIERIRLRWLNEEQTAQYSVAEIREEVWATLDRIKQPRVPVWVVDSPQVAMLIDSLGDNLWANLGANLGANLRANLGANLRANLRDNLRANLGNNLRDSLRDSLGANLGNNLRDSLGANLGNNLRDSLRDSLWANLWANLGANLKANLRDSLGANLGANLGDSLGANLGANLGNNLRDSLGANLGNSLRDSLWVYCGIYLNAWAGWAEGGDLLGVPRHEQYDMFMRWNRVCPVWMWSKSQVFVLRRPTQIHWNETGLHNPSGPSVYYSSAFSLWHIDNIAVDEQIVMRPETQTVKQINEDDNMDRRAIRIDRFGWPRYLQESKAIVIDSRHNEIENTNEALCEVGAGQKRLLVTCPTGRQFALGVPDDVLTCQQAQHWLAGDMTKFNVIGRT